MFLKVSIVIPAMNEERGIGKTIDAINKGFFTNKQWDFEILIIDGNSKDKTRDIATEKGAKVILEKRRGYGRAYKVGLSQATGDVIVTGDADATYPFHLIHEYIEMLLDQQLDFLTTDRFAALKHGSMSLKHRFGNLSLAWTLRILFLVNIRDSQSGMWIFRRDALSKIQPLESFNDGMPFSEEIKIEMFTKKNIKAKEIPSTLSAREGQVKLESFKDGIKNLRFLFVKRVNLSMNH
ncbi:MAG: glycosyltransferase family 2 protein [Candidatus Thermoplasmatota archaeon]|nr:glycosyltransferase family 2 protein [Candidatus Thermoplasmatota archaeon]